MNTTQIIGITFLSIFIIVNIVYATFGIIECYKTKKKLEEYKKCNDFLFEKIHIISNKKVNYEELEKSIDYLTYNSKTYNDDRKLTEDEFNKLKRKYIFYVWPQIYFAPEKEKKE